MGAKIDFHKGVLTQEIFSQLTELFPSNGQETNLTSTQNYPQVKHLLTLAE